MESGHTARPQTLLSAVHALTANGAFPSSSTQHLHPFAESDASINAVLPHLKDVISTTSIMSIALSSHLSLPITDPKLVSLTRQHAALQHDINSAENDLNSRVKALRERRGVEYGEDPPVSKNLIVDWFLEQIEAWGNSAGMQLFKEPESDGKLVMVLAGKILVLDIECRVKRDGDAATLHIMGLKSSHASPLDAPATSASSFTTSDASLDTFLTMTFRRYLGEVQKDQADIDPVLIAKLGQSIRQHLRYIMKLDSLAQREVEGGSRWFTEVDDLGSVASQIVPKEVETVSKELSMSQAPLDILLLRGHALPLPYLRSPSLSFLIYLPPQCYLSLLRSSLPTSEQSPSIDISIATLRAYLSQPSLPTGPVISHLSLGHSSQPHYFAQAQGRPTFPLVPPDAFDDVDLQSLDHILPVDNGPDAWVLDFGPDGVVLSQSRLWEIQLLLGLAPVVDAMHMPMMSFGYGGSWVDILVQGADPISRERYMALYVSPTNAHPPLHLRLSVPPEPGFILRKIRVPSMRDIWAICEIVKEQSWYNALIKSCQWHAEDQEESFDGIESTAEEDLSKILDGTVTPRRIPVNLVFESSLPTLFEPQLHRTHVSLSMVFPSKAPNTPLMHASIALDSSTRTSVRVMVNGVPVPELEESVRRGGGLGLAGRLWATSGG